MVTPPALILASSSRYRRGLLDRLGIPYDCQTPAVNEAPGAGESPEALVRRLAESKARAVAERLPAATPRTLVVGSDQLAEHRGQVLGKPGSVARAVAQLSSLSGNRVRFLTSLCILDTATDQCFEALDETEVCFRDLTELEITGYVERELPLDCAGAFKSEGLGVCLFDAIHSEDPTALIGLPLIALCRGLRSLGYDPLGNGTSA